MTRRTYYLTTRRHLVAGPFPTRAAALAYQRRHELNAAEVRSRDALAAEIKRNVEREAVA